MSVKLMSKAWEMDIPSGQKMVLLALCDHANDDGECYPSQKNLAKKCSMSSRAISNHIKWLHDCGILESERRQTTNVRKSNRYFISLENYQAANSAHANSAHANSAYPNMQNFPSEHANFAPSYIDEPSERTIRVEPSDICDDAFALSAPTVEVEVLPAEKIKPAKPKDSSKSAKLWEAYAAAYQQRYQGALPIRDAKTNSTLCKIIDRVGEKEAIQLAWFYLSHSKAYYTQRSHDVGIFLQDLQAIRTDWVTGRYSTAVQARQAEKTAANLQSHNGAIEILKAKGLM